MSAGTSNQSKRQCAKCGSTSSSRPARLQSSRCGGGIDPAPSCTPTAQLESERPRSAALAADPLDGRLVKEALQLAAMDRELRPGVARVQATRLGPDALAEPVAVDELLGPDAGHVQAFQQTQLGKLLDGVGQEVDADAELANAVGLLEDLDLDALL